VHRVRKKPEQKREEPVKLQKIVSFGFRHEGGGPNVTAGVVVIDIRKLFKNPYHDRKLRQLKGTDTAVQKDIEKTPDFDVKYEHLKEQVSVPGIEIVYIGCTGGKHRSVYLVEKLGKELGVPVEHRDLDKK
jgi:RNase adapter protein RapZ